MLMRPALCAMAVALLKIGAYLAVVQSGIVSDAFQ